MKFGPVAIENAAGSLLAHATKVNTRTLKKGHLLTDVDCRELSAQGYLTIVAATLEAGDMEENEAATRLAVAASGENVARDAAFTGRMNLYADRDGVLVVNEDAVNRVNRINPAITLATLPNHARVSKGRMIATAKIIPFAVPENLVVEASHVIANAVMVAPFQPKTFGLVSTRLPHLKETTMDKTRRVLEGRFRRSGSTLLKEIRTGHSEHEVADAIQDLLATGADFLILFGASAVVDEADVLPAGLHLAGGTVTHLGMPVDPGNLLMLGEIDGLPVLGAPGCARSPKENGFDWVLDRLTAGIEVSTQTVTGMGVGGLLMEIGTRPQPREKKARHGEPKIAAMILGAGKSSRMGSSNKLLATLEEKPLIRHVAEAAIEAKPHTLVAVTGHNAQAVGDCIADLDVTLVHNPDFAEGMAGSIRCGMEALPGDIDAVVVLLGDMPRITSEHIRQLVATYQQDPDNLIVTAAADGKRGNPVLWDKRYFEALKSLSGDIGARQIIADNPGFVAEVEIGAAARLDLDTPEALKLAGGTLPQTILK